MYFKIVERKDLHNKIFYEIYYANKPWDWNSSIVNNNDVYDYEKANKNMNWCKAAWQWTDFDEISGKGQKIFVISKKKAEDIFFSEKHFTDTIEEAKEVIEKMKEFFAIKDYQKIVYEE